ncbi:MAG: hypothetical protein ACOVNU_03610, partial [Candidatus Kapaibacteriota bacterium]
MIYNSINITKIKILVILLIILFPISTQAQLEWNNWIFESYNNLQEMSFKSNNVNKFQSKNINSNSYFTNINKNLYNFNLISTISNKKTGILELYTNG